MARHITAMPMMKQLFLGSKELGLRLLKAFHVSSALGTWSVIVPDDSHDTRSNAEDFELFCSEHSIELYKVRTPGDAARLIAASKADIGFVCGWYWLIGEEVLDTVPGGLWGFHNSLLPAYRGASPLVWSIINGDDVVGATVFRLTAGMDDGPVLHQVRVGIGRDENIGDALSKIAEAAEKELPEIWQLLISGKAKTRAQDESEASYCGQRIERDGLIEWSRPARAVHDFIRAQAPPYPCAYTVYAGKKIKICQSRVCGLQYQGTPGQVLRRVDNEVLVACGEKTAISIVSVLVDGLPVDAASVIRSIHDRL